MILMCNSYKKPLTTWMLTRMAGCLSLRFVGYGQNNIEVRSDKVA